MSDKNFTIQPPLYILMYILRICSYAQPSPDGMAGKYNPWDETPTPTTVHCLTTWVLWACLVVTVGTTFYNYGLLFFQPKSLRT